jgi:hypothetical protein
MATYSKSSPRSVRLNRSLRSLLAAAGCSLVALVAAAPASALSVAPSGEPCDDAFSQPFAAWGDDNLYKLVPGGDFESGADGWELDGGASLVPGSAQFGGETVLSLEPGASALTPAICIDGSEDFSRMLTRSEERKSRVLVTVVTERGLELPVGVVRGDDEWDASRRFLVPPYALLGDQTTFQYRFTAVGSRGTEIDSVYVDPRHKH